MNCRLSCGANRKLKKIGYTYEVGGRIEDSGVFKTVSTNMKENILESIIKGMKACRGKVHHEDLLIIEVQNQHLAQWLSGEVTYKGYEDYLDRLFDVLDKRSQYIIKHYVGYDGHSLTFKEIGDKLNLSESLIARIYKKAILLLKEHFPPDQEKYIRQLING